MQITLKEAINSEGGSMRLMYGGGSYSWHAFSIHGLPARVAGMNGKAMSLSRVVEVWNLCVGSRVDRVDAKSISDRLNERRKAAIEAHKTAKAMAGQAAGTRMAA